MSSDKKNIDAALEQANQAFRRLHTRCFWHSPKDLVVTEDLIPFVIKGLRAHGGHEGYVLSGQIKKAFQAACH